MKVLNSENSVVIATITTPTTNPYSDAVDSAGGIAIR